MLCVAQLGKFASRQGHHHLAHRARTLVPLRQDRLRRLYLLQNVAICAAGSREHPSFAGRRYGDPSKRQIARGAYVARAVREGMTAHPGNLYPTMRFTSYTKMSDADIDALYAYMMAIPPVTQEAPIWYRARRCARPFTKTRKEPCDFPPRRCASAPLPLGS